ncbi:MAG: hypothetical protein ABI743_04015, partial [bacterium]
MHRVLPWTTLALSLPLVASLGCNGHGNPAVTAPSEAVGNAATAPSLIPDVRDPNSGMLAAFDLSIDAAAGRADLTPVRTPQAVGDTFSEIGLAPAFTELFGKNFRVVGLRSTGPTSIEVDFEITHPFAVAKRPDLAIFNTKCWVVTDQPGTTLGSITGVPDLVTNADGHGTMWSDTAATPSTLTTAEVQPYVILNEDPSSAPFDWHFPAGFNVLFPEQSSVDTVALELGGANTLNLHIYLTADYGQSAIRATRQNPQYELPKFAGNAPWKVAVTELGNTLEAGNTASNATWQVDIWDWKHGQSLGSDVTGATLTIPALVATPVALSLSGTGQDPTPLTATTAVPNTLNASAGDYWGLVTVTDEGTGIGLKEDLATPVALGTYTTYQWFPVTVGSVSTVPPTVVLERCHSGDLKQTIEEGFDGSGSISGTNPIATYEWDFDYVGTTFDVDATGPMVEHPYPSNGTRVVALRVSDGGTGTDMGTTSVIVNGAPSWGAPVRLSTTPNQDYLNQSLVDSSQSLATSPDGTVHLVWHHILFAPPFNTTYYYASLSGGCTTPTWSAPQVIYASPTNQQMFQNQAVAVHGDGTVAAMIGYYESGANPRAYAYIEQTSPSTWTTPVAMTQPVAGLSSYYAVSFAVGPTGEVGFLGIGNSSQTNCPGPAIPGNIQFSKKTGATFSALQTIGTSDNVLDYLSGCGGWSFMYGYTGALGCTGSGEFVATWTSLVNAHAGSPVPQLPSEIRWNKTTGGTWGTMADLYTGASAAWRSTMLTRSPNGQIWMLIQNYSTGEVGLSKYDPTPGTWSASPTTVFTPTGYPYLSIDFDSDGRGIIGNSSQGASQQLRVKRFNQNDTIASIAALPVENPEGVIS